MQPTEIILTNFLPTGTGFGVLADDMTQNVFVPSKNIAGMGFKPGDKIHAIIVPNHTHGHKTPWLAISVIEGNPIRNIQADSDEKLVMQDVEEGRATAAEIADGLGISQARVDAALAALLSRGALVKVECYDLPEEV